jgi:hypothetical protein
MPDETEATAILVENARREAADTAGPLASAKNAAQSSAATTARERKNTEHPA